MYFVHLMYPIYILEVGTIIIPISLMWILRHREIKCLVQSHQLVNGTVRICVKPFAVSPVCVSPTVLAFGNLEVNMTRVLVLKFIIC